MGPVDVDERVLAERDEQTLKILLSDKTTDGNIRWATDAYADYGALYQPEEEMTIEMIRGFGFDLIRPRVCKSDEERRHRTREKAEVFTPAWVCNSQNNLVDRAWFGREPGFNVEHCGGWEVIREPIAFDADHTWQDYVDRRVLEVACGEAPYITTRYDSTTGEAYPFLERVGLLDRKLRVVCENAADEHEWLKWARRAVESCYAYDFQGDNVLIARENVLASVEDAYEHQFSTSMDVPESRRIANIIAWNIFQMDGYTLSVPYADRPAKQYQLRLFEIDEGPSTEPIPCKVYDWRAREPIEFRMLVKGTIL